VSRNLDASPGCASGFASSAFNLNPLVGGEFETRRKARPGLSRTATGEAAYEAQGWAKTLPSQSNIVSRRMPSSLSLCPGSAILCQEVFVEDVVD
jgi:hypothetical protein